MSGKLYIVSTPIGNLQDITLRALETLRTVDFIACEDTRHSRKLLQHFQIQKNLFSLHEYNEDARIRQVLQRLEAGEQGALISDAGTPLISDPGYRLIRALLDARVSVEAIPGPCAAIQALVLSGLPTDAFLFLGFLPPKSAARLRRFAALQDFPHTLVFYESTHRIDKFLSEAFQIFGPRPIAILREMTKLHEEAYRGFLQPRLADYPMRSWKGEFVIVVAGKQS